MLVFGVTNRFSRWVKAWIHTDIHAPTHTRGSEEGPRQPAVSGDLSDLCGDVDESTNHWRDPVKAQQSETGQDREMGTLTNNNKRKIHKKQRG